MLNSFIHIISIIMKKSFFQLVISLLAIATLSSCIDEVKLPESDIEILFVTPQLNIDLNSADNPPVISVVNSVNPLKEVRIYVIRTGGIEELMMEPVKEFYNNNSYSLRFIPIYKEDMHSVKIIAEDIAGKTVENILPFIITPMKNAPSIELSVDSITASEGSPTWPDLQVNISSEVNLKYVRITKVVNRAEILIDTVKTFSPANQFIFNVKTFSLPNDFFELKMTAIKFEAVDIYGKIRIGSVKVSYVELPYPSVSFNGPNPVNINEFTNITLSGSISSFSDIQNVSIVLKSKNDTDLQLEEKTFSSGIKSHNFSFGIEKIKYHYNALEVKVIDVAGKQTIATLPINVNELYPAPVINTENYEGILRTDQIILGTQEKPLITSSVGIQNIKIETFRLDGTLISKIVDDNFAAGTLNYYYPSTLPASDLTLGNIRVTVTDLNDKITIKNNPVTVEFYLLKNLVMGPETVLNPLNNPTSPVFFSSIDKKFLSPTEAYYKQTNCDFSFYNPASFPGRIYIYPMSHSDVAIKYGGSSGAGIKVDGQNAGPGAWQSGNRNATTFGAFSNASLPQSQFGQYTVDDIKSRNATSGSATLVYMDSGESNAANNGAANMIVFQTINRNGKIQKGIIKYEGIAPASTSKTRATTTTYLVSIQLTIPY